MKWTIKELAETETTDVRGATVGTKYGLQPIQFLREIVDAAKKQLYFTQFVKVISLPKGTHDVVIPKRTKYEGRSGMTFNAAGSDTGGSGAGTGPYANTIADISWTSLDNLSNETITPMPVLAGYALRTYDLDTSAVNLLEEAKAELSYAIGDRVDRYVATTIGDATMADSATTGAQVIYGGDATSSATLADGDTITTDLVAKGGKYLKLETGYYRASGSGAYGTEARNSVTKNPWMPDNSEPFVLFIGPSQEETFLKDSQFVNAAEYGSDKIIHNGEIGEYLRTKIIVTNNVETVAYNSTGPDTQTVACTSMTRCIMMKAKRAAALVWGRQPRMEVFKYETRDQIRIGLSAAYAAAVVHDDAIVFIDVSDV